MVTWTLVMLDDTQLAKQLLNLKLVDRDKLAHGRSYQEKDKSTLYDALITHHIVEESLIVDVAASLISIPSVNLARYEFKADITGLISPSMARRTRALPLAYNGNQILIAMADPLDIMAMDEIATHTGIDIQPVLVGPRDLDHALARAYSHAESLSHAQGNSEINPMHMSENSELADQDSWGTFFDEALSSDSVGRESSDIAQNMRDRPSSLEFELSKSDVHGNSEPAMDLAGWEVNKSDAHRIDKGLLAQNFAEKQNHTLMGTPHTLNEHHKRDLKAHEESEVLHLVDELSAPSAKMDSEHADPSEAVYDSIFSEFRSNKQEPPSLARAQRNNDLKESKVHDALHEAPKKASPTTSEPRKPALKSLALLRQKLKNKNAPKSSLSLQKLKSTSQESPPQETDPTLEAKALQHEALESPDDARQDEGAINPLGRVAIKRIAVKKSPAAVVERSSFKERTPDPEDADSEPEILLEEFIPPQESTTHKPLTQELDLEDVLSVQPSTHHDQPPSPPHNNDHPTVAPKPNHKGTSSHRATIEIDTIRNAKNAKPLTFGHLEPQSAQEAHTREVSTEDLFHIPYDMGQSSVSLQEETATADDEMRQHVEEITGYMRSFSDRNDTDADKELSNRVTTMNQSLTMERLHIMKQKADAQLKTPAEFLAELPTHITQNQLMRAAVAILLSEDFFNLDELIALAESIDEED